MHGFDRPLPFPFLFDGTTRPATSSPSVVGLQECLTLEQSTIHHPRQTFVNPSILSLIPRLKFALTCLSFQTWFSWSVTLLALWTAAGLRLAGPLEPPATFSSRPSHPRSNQNLLLAGAHSCITFASSVACPALCESPSRFGVICGQEKKPS